jgi:hypothetical protein
MEAAPPRSNSTVSKSLFNAKHIFLFIFSSIVAAGNALQLRVGILPPLKTLKPLASALRPHPERARIVNGRGGGVAPTTAIEKVPPPPPVVPPHRNGFEQSLDPNAFLAALTPKLLDYVEGQADTAEPTVKFAGPREIGEAFEAAGCPLPIGEEAVEANDIMRACDRIMEYSVRTSSPLFNNQLYGAADPVAVAGDFMVAALNPSAYTYEVAPVFSLMETELIVKIGSILGGDYANRNVVDGLFVPGGSISNLYALQIARHNVCPEVKTEGNSAGGQLCAFGALSIAAFLHNM